MSAPEFDIAVVGGGIAAAAAVRSLAASGRSVVVIAPAPETASRIGESLSPSAQGPLRALGLLEQFEQAEPRRSVTSFSSWGTPALLERSMTGAAGWIVDRRKFEEWLWHHAVGAGEQRIEARLLSAERSAASWSLTLNNGRTTSAAFVLDCSGRSAVFTRRRTEVQRRSALVAAYSFLEQRAPKEVTPTPAIVVESRPEGWWYSSLLPDGELVLAFFTDGDLLPRGLRHDLQAWRALLAAAPYTQRRVAEPGFDVAEAPQITDAGTMAAGEFWGRGWAVAGDSALAMDPLSGHGMTHALWSGRRAALGALAQLEGDDGPLQRYADSGRAGLASYELGLVRAYGSERRFAQSPFWQRRSEA